MSFLDGVKAGLYAILVNDNLKVFDSVHLNNNKYKSVGIYF